MDLLTLKATYLKYLSIVAYLKPDWIQQQQPEVLRPTPILMSVIACPCLMLSVFAAS